MRGYWGYYWNGFYGYGYGYGYGYKRDNDEHNHQHHRDRHVDGCSEWEAVLAFSFISFVCFFISMCIVSYFALLPSCSSKVVVC